MTISEYPTYTPAGGGMKHTGFIVQCDGLPLKFTLAGPWRDIKSSPRYRLDPVRCVGALQDLATTVVGL